MAAASWAKAKADWATHGPKFFMTLFDKAPDTYAPFQKFLFGGKDVSAVKDTTEMKNQADAFGNLIDKWVANLGNEAALKESCADFSKKHKDRGVSKAQVEKAFGIFVDYLKDNFGANPADWKPITDSLLGMMTL